MTNRRVAQLAIAVLVLAALFACDSPYEASLRSECVARFRMARTSADTIAILDKPQGPRLIYCGAFIDAPRSSPVPSPR